MSFKIRAEKKPPSSLTTLLPDDVIVDVVARVPNRYYPAISLVSKSFRALVASPELYTRRSSLGCTEQCLYVVLCNWETKEHRLFFLRRKANGNCLVDIKSLPPMPSNGRYVAAGTKIYVVGGFNNSVFSIDGVTHAVQPISDIPKPMVRPVAVGIIDGKIYVIGDCLYRDDKASGRVMVFDTKTQTWEPEMTKPKMNVRNIWSDGLVMEDEIYIRDSHNSFFYEPKGKIWEIEEVLHAKDLGRACIVDDVLYYFEKYVNKLRAYDPKQRCLVVVKGVEELSLKTTSLWMSKTVNYGGKLAVFFHNGETWKKNIEIWCAEIALERRQGGEIWGKVEEWRDVVVEDGDFKRNSYIVKCLAFMV